MSGRKTKIQNHCIPLNNQLVTMTKRMKIRHIGGVGALLLLLAGCSADEGGRHVAPDGAIAVTAAIEPVSNFVSLGTTRTTIDYEAATLADCQVKVGVQSSTPTTAWEVLTVGSSSPWKFDGSARLYYPDESAATFTVCAYAFGPDAYGTGVTLPTAWTSSTTGAPGATFTIETDQSSDGNYKKSDLLYACSTPDFSASARSTPQALAFGHLMARLKVEVTNSDRLTVTGVTVAGVKPELTLDPFSSAGYSTSAGSATSVTAHSGGSSTATLQTFYVVVPPQTLSGDLITVTCSEVGFTSFSFTLASPLTVAAGYEYTLGVTIGKTAVSGGTVSMGSWSAGDEVTMEENVTP